MLKFWASWYADNPPEPFELTIPWWQQGYVIAFDGGDLWVYYAAIYAENRTIAQKVIHDAYTSPPQNLTFRFCVQQPDNWSPFTRQFPRADWMQWDEGRGDGIESTKS